MYDMPNDTQNSLSMVQCCVKPGTGMPGSGNKN